MAVAARLPQVADQTNYWLRNRKWDLLYITMSVIFVPLPYLVYLIGMHAFGLEESVSRNGVNAFVAIAVGGPHMMSTFLRTGLDENFKRSYPMMIRSSIIIPIVVVSLAFLNLNLLLTVFFFWAALHVIHQIVYIVELYAHKENKFVRRGSAVSPIARFIDYGVVFSCLAPIAALKISQNDFSIGTNDLTRVIPDFFKQPWLFYLASAVFAVAVVAYVVKTFIEYRNGYFNVPKTVFIVFTVVVAFTMPALPNLDTAFQGLNTWHSFQYLALTFYIIKIRQAYGNLEQTAPLVSQFSKKTKDSRGLYLLSTLMMGGSIMVFIVVYAIANVFTPGYVQPELIGEWRFDVAYYTSILSFLWIHYYHDHFLFTDFETLDTAHQNETI